MSVWRSETQKVDIVRDIYEISPGLVSSIFGPRLYPYLDPDETTSGLARDSSWEDLAIAAVFKPDSPFEDALEDLQPYLKGVESYFVGTPAIYRLFGMVQNGRFNIKNQLDYDKLDAVHRTYSQLLAPSTQITPDKFVMAYNRMDEDAIQKARKWEGIAEGFKRLRMVFRKAEFTEVAQIKLWGEGKRDATMGVAGNVLFMRGTQEYTNICMVFTRKHIDLIIGCAQRISNIYEYLARHWVGQDLDNAMAYLAYTVEVAATAGKSNSYKVARAFHKARAMMQMETLRSVLPESINSEIADYRADGLDDILRLSKYQELMRAFRLTKRVEVLHFYKWMPPPDFDATRALGVVRNWHMNPRTSGADPDASLQSKELWAHIKKERSLHLAHAFHRMTNQWPAGLPHKQSGPSREECANWDYTGILPYYSLGKDISSQVKDKQTVCALKDDEMNGNARAEETSYLLWYLANKEVADTDKWASEYPYHGEDNYARVAYKPEAHKPDSRLFFMAPPKSRTLLGEMEGNLSNVARFYPGCLMGKSASEKKKILLDIMDPHSKLAGVDETVDYETFIVQFDLSKFSPKSNFNVTRDYMAHWAKVYNMPHLERMADLGCKSTIVHTTCGLNMSYENPGADLEGFRGRLMTMFHADLLGAACRLARSRGILTGRAKLAVFIDDGVVKIAVRGLGEEAVANVRAFLRTLQEVYAAAGQDANPSKTCVSQIGGEMLAEFYCHSTQMPSGVKAAMRLHPDYESAVTTIPEEHDTLFSTAQGAVKDGADWAATHAMYTYAALKCVNRWARREFPLVPVDKMALKMMTPKSYGGFGLQPLQGLVTTAVTNLTAEGLAMLNRAARAYPGYRLAIHNIVTTPVIKRDPLSILRDPLRVRADGPVLMENRLVMACVDILETRGGKVGSFITEYQGESLRKHATAVAEALMDSESLSLPVIERVWKSTPLCQVEQLISKFKKSQTIIRMLGRDGVSRIRGGNMKDLKRVLGV